MAKKRAAARPPRGALTSAPAPRGPIVPVVAREWQEWVTENLLRGAVPQQLVDELVAEGLSSALASATVRDIATSPILRAAAPFARESRRLRAFARLDRARWAQLPAPTEVPRVPYPGNAAFFERYWAPGNPVIFTDLVTRWPAMERWTLDRLEARFGNAPVDITDGRSRNPDYDAQHHKHVCTVTMRDYIERIRATESSNDFYMVANNRNTAKELGSVLEDVVLPEGLCRGDLTSGSAFWLGPRGTITPLHHDTSNILFCQVIGRKRYRMIAPLELAVLDGARAMYAAVDPEAPDLERFPWWSAVIVRDFVVGPGDALFIPVGWWHHVRSLDASVSLAINGFVVPNRYEWFVPAKE